MKKTIPNIRFSLLRVFLIASCFLFLIVKYKSEHPRTQWDTSPDQVLISYEVNDGEVDIGYIPDFRVWGDGHILWVERDSNFNREIYEGYLPQSELVTLVNQFADAGLYKWFGNTGDSLNFVGVKLLDRYDSLPVDGNPKISHLVDYLKSGAGVDAEEFIPTVGYLYVLPFQKTEYKNTNVIPAQWAENRYESNFENFDRSFPDGKEITGDELNFVWQIINHSPFIKSNDKIYWIALEIPKITY